MIGVMLQWANYGFADLFNQLESLEFFRLILPFLLIFAVIYAILTKVPVFKDNKGAAVIVAIAIGLLALQLDVVPAFFQAMTPKLAIALSLVLAALILAGAFISDEKVHKWIFFGIGMLAFIVVLITSLSSWQFVGSWWWTQYGALIIVLIVIIGAVVGVILASTYGEKS